jgi:16S rRNA (cytosine967-C5)-methyltransferase
VSAVGAREVATRVLTRVLVDGAFASVALDAELRRASLDGRDAALAAQIVYGALRVVPQLDEVIGRRLHRGNEKLDPFIRALFWAASYQVLFLARVPVHAAVDEAVRLARNERGPKVAGFVNAVLRKVADERPAEPTANPSLELPSWLGARLETSLGPERARAFREGRSLPPPIDLRVSLHRVSRAEVREAIAKARPEATIEDGLFSPAALRLRHAGDPRSLPGFDAGLFVVQEEGSQVIAELVRARPDERVADACAGRGGKTGILAAAVGPGGSITALDLNESRLGQIPAQLARLRLEAELTIEAVDLTVGTAGLDGRFDAVLVDAPCTGLGTVHRRPEILLRLGPEDPARMAEMQAKILRNAARLLRPAGRLVYAVCSPIDDEGPGVLPAAYEAGLELAPPLDPPDAGGLEGLVDTDGVLRLGPWLGDGTRGTDAYQVIRLQRR